MSVSCRSCVYWQRCCRIISTLSTSSLSSSWRGKKKNQVHIFLGSWSGRPVLPTDDIQKVASQCNTAPGSCLGTEFWDCPWIAKKRQQATEVTSALAKGQKRSVKSCIVLFSGILQAKRESVSCKKLCMFVEVSFGDSLGNQETLSRYMTQRAYLLSNQTPDSSFICSLDDGLGQISTLPSWQQES